MLAHHLAQIIMIDPGNPVPVDAHHRLARYQRVHNGFFGRVHGGGE